MMSWIVLHKFADVIFRITHVCYLKIIGFLDPHYHSKSNRGDILKNIKKPILSVLMRLYDSL